MSPFAQSDWAPWACTGLGEAFSPMAYHHQLNTSYHHAGYLTDSIDLDPYQALNNRHLVHHQHPHPSMSRTTESKPRLSKEEVEVLETEFQKNHKPSSSVKKALAESMRVDNARINNWFQNRRAREKKENNIRVYEAKQRLEKDQAEAECGRPKLDSNKGCDLVASSAPFPEPRSALQASPADASPSPSGVSPCEGQNDCSPYTSDNQTHRGDTCSASPAPQMTTEEGPVTPKHTDALQGESASAKDFVSGDASAPADSTYYCLSDADLGVSSVTGPSTDYMQNYRQDFEQVFSESIEVAFPRSRRPAPLTIAGCRPHSCSHTPRGAGDADRRGGRVSPMRRVSQSTTRVSKMVATPRSPFYESKVADMVTFPPRRSPGSAHTSRPVATVQAPPTPDTPMALQHHGHQYQHQTQPLMEGENVSSYSMDAGNGLSTDLALQDPTLRTPPATPGFMDSLFSGMASSASTIPYNMAASDDALIPPTLGRLTSSFDMPSIPTSFVGDAAERHGVSLLPSQMGSGYFGGFLGSGTDYHWADASV